MGDGKPASGRSRAVTPTVTLVYPAKCNRTDAALQSIFVGGGEPNQLSGWTLTATTLTVDTMDFNVYVSNYRLDCRAVGGKTMEVYP